MIRARGTRGIRAANQESGTRPRAADDGFSLPELIVAIALTAVVLTMVVTLFTSFSKNFTRERALNDSTTSAGIGMNEVTRVIRAGTILDRKTTTDLPVFVKADRESVLLYSYLADDATDRGPVMIDLTIGSKRQLTEKRWNATRDTTNNEWIFPDPATAPPASSRVLVWNTVAPTAAELAKGGQYLFTYLSQSGSVIPVPVPAAERGNVASVQVTMTVQADVTGRAEKVTLQNRVGIPNLAASRLGLKG